MRWFILYLFIYLFIYFFLYLFIYLFIIYTLLTDLNLLTPFSYMTKKSRQKFKYLENEKSF